MKWSWWLVGLALGAAGCASLEQEERADDYVHDGVALFQHGEYTAARETFQAALVIRPRDPGLLYNIGECYDRQGNTAKAEESYNACLQVDSNNSATRHALAVLLVLNKRQDEAACMIQDWLAREPKLPAAYAEDGWLWHQLGYLPRAQRRLEQALEFDPHDTYALIELGRVYEEMHRPDRALALYERVLEHEPDQTEIARRVNGLLAQGVTHPHPD